MTTTLNKLSESMTGAFNRFQKEKKTPYMMTASTAKEAQMIHETIVRELSKVRMNIEMVQGLMRRVPSTNKAVTSMLTRAMKNMRVLKDEYIKAERRWRRMTPGTKSVYPLTDRENTSYTMMVVINRLFDTIKEKHESNTSAWKGKASPITLQRGNVVASTANLNKSPSTMFGLVRDAWDAYLKQRRGRRGTPSVLRKPGNTQNKIETEISVLRAHRVMFKSVRNRAVPVSKQLGPLIKKVITKYDVYVRHYEDAYAMVKKGKPAPSSPLNGGKGPAFVRAVLRFFEYVSAKTGQGPISNVVVQRRQANVAPQTASRLTNIEANALRKNMQLRQTKIALDQARREIESKTRDIDALSREIFETTDALMACEREKRNLMKK